MRAGLLRACCYNVSPLQVKLRGSSDDDDDDHDDDSYNIGTLMSAWADIVAVALNIRPLQITPFSTAAVPILTVISYNSATY
jgi:hypothetical protein